jgi:hypothetical protein
MVMTGGSPLMAAYAIDGQLAPAWPVAAGNPLATGPAQFGLQGVLIPQQVLDPETQAISAFLQSASSCLIPKLSNYLGRNVGQFPQLTQCVPLATRAADFYGQRDFARAVAQVYQAYRLIALLRSQQPGLPDPTS